MDTQAFQAPASSLPIGSTLPLKVPDTSARSLFGKRPKVNSVPIDIRGQQAKIPCVKESNKMMSRQEYDRAAFGLKMLYCDDAAVAEYVWL